MQNAYIQLDYLDSVAPGDTQLVRETLSLLSQNLPESLKELSNAARNQDIREVQRIAHRMMSSVTVVFQDATVQVISQIEDDARDQKPMESIELLIDRADELIQAGLKEISKTLESIS